MNNSYKMIVIKKTIEEIIYNNTDKYIFFAHDIEKDPDVEDIKFILNHFEELEEFEKCIELYKLILVL